MELYLSQRQYLFYQVHSVFMHLGWPETTHSSTMQNVSFQIIQMLGVWPVSLVAQATRFSSYGIEHMVSRKGLIHIKHLFLWRVRMQVGYAHLEMIFIISCCTVETTFTRMYSSLWVNRNQKWSVIIGNWFFFSHASQASGVRTSWGFLGVKWQSGSSQKFCWMKES